MYHYFHSRLETCSLRICRINLSELDNKFLGVLVFFVFFSLLLWLCMWCWFTLRYRFVVAAWTSLILVTPSFSWNIGRKGRVCFQNDEVDYDGFYSHWQIIGHHVSNCRWLNPNDKANKDDKGTKQVVIRNRNTMKRWHEKEKENSSGIISSKGFEKPFSVPIATTAPESDVGIVLIYITRCKPKWILSSSWKLKLNSRCKSEIMISRCHPRKLKKIMCSTCIRLFLLIMTHYGAASGNRSTNVKFCFPSCFEKCNQ